MIFLVHYLNFFSGKASASQELTSSTIPSSLSFVTAVDRPASSSSVPPLNNQPLVIISPHAWKTLIKEESMDENWNDLFFFPLFNSENIVHVFLQMCISNTTKIQKIVLDRIYGALIMIGNGNCFYLCSSYSVLLQSWEDVCRNDRNCWRFNSERSECTEIFLIQRWVLEPSCSSYHIRSDSMGLCKPCSTRTHRRTRSGTSRSLSRLFCRWNLARIERSADTKQDYAHWSHCRLFVVVRLTCCDGGTLYDNPFSLKKNIVKNA